MNKKVILSSVIILVALVIIVLYLATAQNQSVQNQNINCQVLAKSQWGQIFDGIGLVYLTNYTYYNNNSSYNNLTDSNLQTAQAPLTSLSQLYYSYPYVGVLKICKSQYEVSSPYINVDGAEVLYKNNNHQTSAEIYKILVKRLINYTQPNSSSLLNGTFDEITYSYISNISFYGANLSAFTGYKNNDTIQLILNAPESNTANVQTILSEINDSTPT